MSAVPIVARSYEAFARGDMDAVLADMHPDIEWHQAQGLPHGGLYRGVDEVRRRVFDPLDRDWWAEFVVTPEQFLDAGEDVVVVPAHRDRTLALEVHQEAAAGLTLLADRGPPELLVGLCSQLFLWT